MLQLAALQLAVYIVQRIYQLIAQLFGRVMQSARDPGYVDRVIACRGQRAELAR